MRALLALFLILLAGSLRAQTILLVPLDNRPASGQYAEITGSIGGAQVLSPPMTQLGNYTIPGSPDAILRWLDSQDLSTCRAMIVSVDMICYGSLFESRKNTVSLEDAKARLKRLFAIRAKAPSVRLYLYSSIMRLTPSATHDAASYRLALARYVEERASKSPDLSVLKSLRAAIPSGAVEEYDATRARDLAINHWLIQNASSRSFDYLVIGQDDASPTGPHIAERQSLSDQISRTQVGAKIRLCEGVDQVSSLLMSRALLGGDPPLIRVRYSDDAGKSIVAPFETHSLEDTVLDQVLVSGGRLAGPTGKADYTLYVNTPNRDHSRFTRFLTDLQDDLDAGRHVAVADANLSKVSAAPDPELFTAISAGDRPLKLMAYAAWNTAANTIGSAIAAANMQLEEERHPTADEQIAQKQYLLLRMANDFAYHTYTRQIAYQMTDGPRQAAIFGKDFYDVSDYVKRDLEKYLKKAFFEHFLGREFKVGDQTYEFQGISDLQVSLPWPRPYEVRLEFSLVASQKR